MKVASRQVALLISLVVLTGTQGCSKSDVKNEAVAQVNADAIQVKELREFLGIPGGVVPAGEMPPERKKETLFKLIDGRLLAQDARARGLDNTEAFREKMRKGEEGTWATALIRREVETKAKVSDKEIQGEAKLLQEADKNLHGKEALARARAIALQKNARKVQEDMIAVAKKEIAATIHQDMLDKLGRGEKLAGDAVLGTVGGKKVTYGDAQKALQGVPVGVHGGRELSTDPIAVRSFVDREVTSRALVAYARKHGIEGTEWIKFARGDLERSILINLAVEKSMQMSAGVTESEIRDAYKRHAQMLSRDGKRIPLTRLKEELRRSLQNEKRKKALNGYLSELRQKAKITIDEKVLDKV